MEANALHDLTAAYALDALDAVDARAYEEHLARCERCREELAALSDAAGALAYATEAPLPAAELRARILQQTVGERDNVMPLRSRWVAPLAAAAAVAACAAIALGLWAASLSNKLDDQEAALTNQERLAQILGTGDLRVITRANGTLALAVTPGGNAALVWHDVKAPPDGHTYEAWVAAAGGKATAAGLFGGGKVVAVPLNRPVTEGATVMVTVEPSGGRTAPSSKPVVVLPYRGAQS